MADAAAARARSPLSELTMARLRELIREPEAVFWVFVFPSCSRPSSVLPSAAGRRRPCP